MVGEAEPVGLGFLADALVFKEYKPGDVLYKSGDAMDSIFLLSQGQVELRWDDGTTNYVGNGTLLGWHRCRRRLHGNRAARLHSQHNGQDLFGSALGIHHDHGLRPDKRGLDTIVIREGLIDGMRVFAKFSETQRRQLTGFFSHNRYPTNHLLVQQNEAADSLWVLMPGSNAIIDAIDKDGRNMRDTVVTGPTYFAETALLGQIPQDSTVEADAGSEWLRLHWHDFEYFDVLDPADLRAKLQVKGPSSLACWVRRPAASILGCSRAKPWPTLAAATG